MATWHSRRATFHPELSWCFHHCWAVRQQRADTATAGCPGLSGDACGLLWFFVFFFFLMIAGLIGQWLRTFAKHLMHIMRLSSDKGKVSSCGLQEGSQRLPEAAYSPDIFSGFSTTGFSPTASWGNEVEIGPRDRTYSSVGSDTTERKKRGRIK